MYLPKRNRNSVILFAAYALVCSLALSVSLTACGHMGTPAAEQGQPEVQDDQSQTETPADGASETTDEQSEATDDAQEPASDEPEEAPSPTRDYSREEAAIQEVVAPYGTDVSVVYVPLDDPQGGVRLTADVQMRSASMIKVPILATLLEKADAGEVSLQSEHTLTWDEIVGGTGSLQGSGAGATLTVDELAWHMIAESDNTATNVLIDLLGFDAVNDTAARLSLTQTQLSRKMMDYDAIARGEDNYTSAQDIATLLIMIGRNELVSPEQSERALGYLKAQTDAMGITQGLPTGTVFAHKTDTLDDVRHDGGIVYPETGDPYVLVVMCHLPEYSANTVATEVSRAVWEAREAA